jgi:AraC family transcriptional regulator
MRENLDAPLSLTAMAAEAAISRFHLLRMFKQAYGETPFKRLTRLRMEEAQRRLRQGHESVTEIAFACGYENPAHFASAFRRSVGVAPSSYRRAGR